MSPGGPIDAVVFQPDLGAEARRLLQLERPRPTGLACIVSDPHSQPHADPVAAAWEAAGGTVVRATVPAGEAAKTLDTLEDLWDTLLRLPADRGTLVIAVGGGALGDVVGLAASTALRGLPWVVLPTTLLAMVDSALGGKVGINRPAGKNLIGAFHHPLAIWIVPQALTTLPEREYRSGLAEVVKYGVIAAPTLFQWIEANSAALTRRDPAAVLHVVRECLQIKSDVVQQDEREETGLRAQLNYGHTFAHAFETVAGHGTWLHGEAVAAGMICAPRLARRLGLCHDDLVERQHALLAGLGLPVRPDPAWDPQAILAAMALDKKQRAGKLRFVLPRRLGCVELIEVTESALVAASLRDDPCPPI